MTVLRLTDSVTSKTFYVVASSILLVKLDENEHTVIVLRGGGHITVDESAEAVARALGVLKVEP